MSANGIKDVKISAAVVVVAGEGVKGEAVRRWKFYEDAAMKRARDVKRLLPKSGFLQLSRAGNRNGFAPFWGTANW